MRHFQPQKGKMRGDFAEAVIFYPSDFLHLEFFYFNQNSTNYEKTEENLLFWMEKGTKITFSANLQVRGRDSRIHRFQLFKKTYFLLEKVWHFPVTWKLQLYLAYLARKTQLNLVERQAVEQFPWKSQEFSAGALLRVSFSSLRKWPL